MTRGEVLASSYRLHVQEISDICRKSGGNLFQKDKTFMEQFANFSDGRTAKYLERKRIDY